MCIVDKMGQATTEQFLIGDLHIGHKAVLNFSREFRQGQTIEEHTEWLIKQWNSVVKKYDKVWVLGDVVFGERYLNQLSRFNGYKNLVRGNHDQLSAKAYLRYFNNIFGIIKLEKLWLTHAPIHPLELRGKFNAHGHVHQKTISDERYINCSVENIKGVPISLTQIREKYYNTEYALADNREVEL
jgi:calcineurin-like phosphoesterase family protein